MRDRVFSMMQQTLESTASFMICVKQECTYQGVDATTTYHALISKLDINMRALLDNVQVNKRSNGGVVSCGQMW